MKKLLIPLILVWSFGCGPSALNVKTSFEQAQSAYNKLLTTRPESIDTQGYRVYMSKAKAAYANNDFSDADTYAKQAIDQADKAYSTRLQLKADARDRIEQTRMKMNNLLVPGHESVHEFFAAVTAYTNARYRDCISKLSDVSHRLDIDTQTAFLNKVTIYVPENLTARFGASVPVFAFLGQDLRLHKEIARIKGPVEVDFVSQFFVSEDFSYFHIKSTQLNLDGWVYPQFVVIGKIKEIKQGVK